MPQASPLNVALARMNAEFLIAGHSSSLLGGQDVRNPLHGLYSDTKRLLEHYCPKDSNNAWAVSDRDAALLSNFSAEIYQAILRAECVYLPKYLYTEEQLWEKEFKRVMPRHAETLALRFATPDQKDNDKIEKLLAKLDSLHLWQVPRLINVDTGGADASPRSPKHCTASEAVERDTRAAMADAAHSSASRTHGWEPPAGDAGWDSPSGGNEWGSSVGAPTEPDSIEAALKLGLGDTERRVKAIQDAKKKLQSKLAIVEEAETAVLKAQDAIQQAQKAMTQSDLALLQSQVNSLALALW
ncbi:uncharacterized protein LMH87_008302 [Akanthomyces muscarius]|uniref:Uncharacterized protein n=1 Tax=Akanthomyces muscarius TaxID=2231603 RepID=A0A9W8QLE6_AKAMU|nr:uncharacterized protein LMH87_008302 [Akanthomyces muscarius]KAJ4159400.1 hypothetical protein LMH87_008302 [Akanthomyces muscarius]